MVGWCPRHNQPFDGGGVTLPSYCRLCAVEILDSQEPSPQKSDPVFVTLAWILGIGIFLWAVSMVWLFGLHFDWVQQMCGVR